MLVIKKSKGAVDVTIGLKLEDAKIIIIVLYDKDNSFIFDV